MHNASELNKQLTYAESDIQSFSSRESMVGITDESVMHAGVGILRQQIANAELYQND